MDMGTLYAGLAGGTLACCIVFPIHMQFEQLRTEIRDLKLQDEDLQSKLEALQKEREAYRLETTTRHQPNIDTCSLGNITFSNADYPMSN